MGVQEQIDQLNARVQRLERSKAQAPQKKTWRERLQRAVAHPNEEDASRILGWFLLTLSLAGLSTRWSNGDSVTVFLVFCLGISLWLIIRASHFFEMSDSLRQLQSEHRATKAVSGHAVHHKVRTRVRKQRFSVDQQVILFLSSFIITIVAAVYLVGGLSIGSDAQVGLFSALLFGVSAWAYSRRYRGLTVLATIGLYLYLLTASLSVTAAWALLLATALLWVMSWQRGQRAIGTLVLLGGTATLLNWYAAAYSVDISYTLGGLLGVTGMGIAVAGLVPFIRHRREVTERGAAALSLSLAGIAFVTSTLYGPNLDLVDSITLSVFALVILYGVCAYAAWKHSARYSYAKYYMAAALAVVVFYLYVMLDPVSVTLIWFMLSILVLAVGFASSSYSARMVGLGLTAGAVAQYLVGVMADPLQFTGPIILRERVWLGVILALFLPVVAQWYKEAPLRGKELVLTPLIRTVLYATSFLILFALVSLDGVALWVSPLWLVLAIVGLYVARWQKLSLLTVLSLLLLIISLWRIASYDMLVYTFDGKLIAALVVGVVLLFLGTNHQYLRHFHQHHKQLA